ncbi:hypothetical protein [Phenylobacterium sp.]|uniref:hypothetical protein n=1 Tax=Phenylobacterium sp. TaxID=1871053 RepID=UPI002C4D2710|nr:hypothetical protein [Phenylobacterium sp.]HLZ77302.1 hypothetical protein [Phenylobacterium sp.]
MSIASITRRMALGVAAAALLCGSASAQAPQAYDGVWAGAISAGGQTLHLELTVKTANGETTAEMNSLDQGATIPASAVKTDGGQLSLLFLSVGAEYTAKLSADGKSLAGSFTQGGSVPLTMTKK